MISDARARPREEEDVVEQTQLPARPSDDPGTIDERVEPARGSADDGDDRDGARSPRTRPSLPLVPVLDVLLVLLLGGVGYLWFTRPEASGVRTGDYVEALQAARSGVVDMTS
ncbi:MAG: hypothetical protein JF630_05525, partial [Geodermatophilales bacterium]|nr:hypothetical protein [Geodermatophilales bacterium]